MVTLFQTQVPKVIVMGSSTTSETTINTSTDSSNTMVTTMTATDGDNTEDSLDMTESMDIMNAEMNEGGRNSLPLLQPMPMSPSTPTAHNTAGSKFVFDMDTTPKTAYFRNKEKGDKFVFDSSQNEGSAVGKDCKTVDALMEEQIEALKQEAKRRNSYKAAQHSLDNVSVVISNSGCGMEAEGLNSVQNHTPPAVISNQVSSSPKRRNSRRKVRSYSVPVSQRMHCTTGNKFCYERVIYIRVH